MTGTVKAARPAPAGRAAAPALRTLAVELLEAWARRQATGEQDGTAPCDPGVPALAVLVADTGMSAEAAAAGDAVAVWARGIGRGQGHPGLYDGGLAGSLAGLRLAARLHPRLHQLADRLRDHLITVAKARPWRPEGVRFPDYDLIVGPSGTLLSLCVGTDPSEEQLASYLGHLRSLCSDGDLPRLRTDGYDGHPYLDWMQGRINTGMGHGVAGLVTALTAAVRHTGSNRATRRALRNATHWLARQSFDDARSIRSWDGAGLDGPPPDGARARQAWCYGNPGVTWALWDAADALGDATAAAWAARAFTGLAERYDTDFHLFGDHPADLLACCHGAAGVLAVADAFHHHARLPAATALRARLARHLLDRLPDVRALGEERMGLLGGATGPLCALLTVAVPEADRLWQPCFGLR
ncbi:lanthionine synthetase LanC family protein [Streptomyces rimosus]|uniref:lanthionine synthetase LanC family protein n=1 Tax=Streptomyces rimosus TaxID=1927 RepID=UPI00067CA581|nr:lanthionine synthetase LanC family protein [Streptomyces rimosus]